MCNFNPGLTWHVLTRFQNQAPIGTRSPRVFPRGFPSLENTSAPSIVADWGTSRVFDQLTRSTQDAIFICPPHQPHKVRISLTGPSRPHATRLFTQFKIPGSRNSSGKCGNSAKHFCRQPCVHQLYRRYSSPPS